MVNEFFNSIYWPEAFGKELNFVGYNRAVKQLQKALGDIVSDKIYLNTKARLYCNIPFHHDPKSLKVTTVDFNQPCRKVPTIAYTMFESTQLPKSWAKFLNKHIDAIITPTQFCADVFRLSGVTIPIKVACLGIDRDEFKYIPPVEHEGFNFFWQGHNYDPNGRKGAKFVEQAFKELRAEGHFNESIRLYLKYRPHQNFPISLANVEVEPGIIHFSETLSREAMNALLSIMDCCVNPSRGEGFGYIPLEQASIGRPVIVTDWSYPYANDDFCIKVRYDLKKSPTIWCYKHIAINGLGIEYNSGYDLKYLRLPKRMQRVPNGCYEFGANGKEEYIGKSIWKTIYNFIVGLHEKSRFYQDVSRKFRYELKFESTGYDAEVNIQDLKNKMLHVYKNKESYASMGPQTSESALSAWSLERIRNEFVQALTELTEEGAI